MKFHPKKINLSVITMIFLMFTVFFSLGHSTNQLSFILDLDNPVFTYEENLFNDSTSFQLLQYTDNGNKTVWVNIPKNSMILYSKITLKGESKPTQTYVTDDVFSIAVGDVITSTSENEIAVGAREAVNLLNFTGVELWSHGFPGYNILGVDIGNVNTTTEGNEIAAACNDKNVYLMRASDGSTIWNYPGTHVFNDVAVGEVNTSISGEEIAAASSDNNVYLLDSNGQKIWNYSNLGEMLSVAIGDVNTTIDGNEIVVGDDDHRIYLLDSNGKELLVHYFGSGYFTETNDIAIGDVIPGGDNEIAIATDNKQVYLLDPDLNILWNFSTTLPVVSVAIGNVTADPGNEVVAGSTDNRVYVLTSTGQLILSYNTEGWVQGVDVGDITADPGNEVVAGSTKGNIHILNFEYYPTNVYLDIGGDGDKDWQHSSSKLREPVSVSDPSINQGIQDYLDSSDCASQVCNVPLVFHSDSGGALNVTSINITYDYNASEAIFSSGPIDAWSRTYNIVVNETVGNQSKSISYAYPANDIEIRYIKIDSFATECNFAGKQCFDTTIDGLNVCDLDVDIVNLNKQGTLPSSSLLWDNTMTSGTPVFGTKSNNFTTPTGEWLMNYTIWNETPTISTTFYNVTAKIAIDPQVKSNEGLFVYWESSLYDITPSLDCTNYEYEKITIGADDFYACKCLEDFDGGGASDCFKLKQPHTSIVNYKLNGSTNSRPVLGPVFVMGPDSDIWGNNFTFSVDVYDYEEDNVTVNLWIHHIDSDVWEKVDSKNTTGNTSETDTLIFEIPSDKSWIGNNWYKYEYADFDGTTNEYIHYFENITPSMIDPFVVLKHSTSGTVIEGDGASVTRTGSDSAIFTVVITDTDWNQNVSDGVNCGLWATKDGTNFIFVNSTTTNSSGFCNFIFDPDESYGTGQQWWKAGVYQDLYYNDSNSTNATVNIYGELGINLTIIGQNFTRGMDSTLEAKLVDENLNDVALPGYNCTWYINNQYNGSSVTDNAGHCNHTWKTDCSSYLGSYLINVTLSDGASSYYTITNNESSGYVILKGTLNMTIILPVDNSIVYEKQDVALNSTVTDECLTQGSYSHAVTWHSPRTDVFGSNFFWCPSDDDIKEIAQGMDTTWVTSGYSWWFCTPRYPQVIIANATGDLYNFDEKNVSIYIWGFADVEVTTPNEGEVVWRNQSYDGGAIGEVKVICGVTSNVTDHGEYLTGYPVDFWEKYIMGSFNYLGSDTVDDSEAVYWWNISSNTTVPEGDHTIRCNIADQPNLYFNTSVAEDNITVTVKGPEDWLPPVFLRISANSVEQYKENVIIEADVYDAWEVDNVWVIITYPNGTNSVPHDMNNVLLDTWRYSENFTDLGDYDFAIFANDTTGNEAQTSSWFEVYLPLILTGNITDWNGNNNITAELNFYRNGTSYLIHQVNTNSSYGYYNLSVHKRLYDLEVKVFNHTILFHDFNTTATAEQQFNTTEITNITNPLNFTEIDVTWIRPARYITRLTAFDINSILVNGMKTLIMNYSSATDKIEYEPAVRISRCPSWSYTDTICSSWDDPAGIPDLGSDTVSINVTSLSVYAAIEAAICGDGYCHPGEGCAEAYYCPDDCPKCPTGETGGPSDGGGGGGVSRAVCGNGICEAGENSQNCPKDCGPPETLFSVRTNLTEPQLNPGTEETYAIWITNNVNYPINTSFSVTGSVAEFISFEKDSIKIDANKQEINNIYVTIPSNADTGTYTGHISVTGDGKTITLPVSLTVSIKGAVYLDVLVEARNKVVGINETARFRVMLYNYGLWKMLDLNLTYFIVDPETQEVFYEENEQLEITQSKTLDKRIPLSELDISVGRYLFNVTVQYDSKVASAYDDFEITESFWTTDRINQAIIVIVVVSVPIALYFVRKRYISWRLSKARYIFPLDFRKLPEGRIWLGKIAETNRKAFFNMKELRTHVLTAGATGSGKSVSAMIFVEELLRENVPVIVFDPTAQWSGFVRPCKDPNLLKFYKEFGMDKREVKPYRGMIYEVTDPNVKIDFDKYMNPGEITVFMLNKLKPGQYDDAVRNIIDTIFAHGWEESTKLRMVVVFDEVHRLLEKYGGKGGYVSLEKACREFRKWGIGLIMASQVLSDFKEAIKGNVLTEIQLHTKSLGDLGRVEKKYGIEYAKRVTRLEVGVGMMQNPSYNKGRPWFVAFRPTLHEPHKIPDRDLETYKEYAGILAKIEAKIESMEKAGQDVFDLKTEFKLAQDKLKKGRFRMAKIYIDSLKKHVLGG